MNKMHYVLGFCFDDDLAQVVLIAKLRPAWQAGKLNGLGGKVLPQESGAVAMAREFGEECGVGTSPLDWTHFCKMSGVDFEVHCFAMASSKVVEAVHSVTDETIQVRPVTTLHTLRLADGLPWLVPMAVHSLTTEMSAEVKYA